MVGLELFGRATYHALPVSSEHCFTPFSEFFPHGVAEFLIARGSIIVPTWVIPLVAEPMQHIARWRTIFPIHCLAWFRTPLAERASFAKPRKPFGRMFAFLCSLVDTDWHIVLILQHFQVIFNRRTAPQCTDKPKHFFFGEARATPCEGVEEDS